MTIQDELLAIKGNKEMLLAEDVIAWARSHPKSKLHQAIEWDDRKAADEHRLWQARRLIALHITFDDGERKFVSLSVDRTRDGGGYRDIEDVVRDKMLHDIMLADALNELQRVQLKYERLKQLKPVWREVARLKRKAEHREEQRKAG